MAGERKTEARLVFSIGVPAHDGSPSAVKARVLKRVALPGPLGALDPAEVAGEPSGDTEATRFHPESGMVFVPSGAFVMGDDEGSRDEQPEREVEQDAFWIDRFPVTNKDYKRFVDATGHRRPPHWVTGTYRLEVERHPVTNVSYKDAQAYAAWVGKRLPTEAEWEKAARGTLGQTYPWGDAFRKDHVNSHNNYGGPTPVDRFPGGASPYGVMDMSGNVMEWCEDWYYEDQYATAASKNPVGPAGGEYRCLRGGFYAGNKADVRATSRHWAPEENLQDHLGFRCAKTPVPVNQPRVAPPSEQPTERVEPQEERKMVTLSEDQALPDIARDHPEAVAKVIRHRLSEEGEAALRDVGVLLVSLGRPTAAGILKFLMDPEIDLVARAMADRAVVMGEERDRVYNDFKGRVLGGTHIDYGGADFAKSVLESALGPRKARVVVDRTIQRESTIRMILDAPTEQIIPFLRKEHPQTIALLLSQLDSAKSAQILGGMESEVADEVLERMGTMASVKATTLRHLEEALVNEMRSLLTGQVEAGGKEKVAEIVGHMEKSATEDTGGQASDL